MHTRLIALLPMKAHSERVPAKNFRALRGKPLFRWVLDTLLSMDEVEQIVINTDARSELQQHGIPVDSRILIRDRRIDLCGDSVSMNLILADDIAAISADLYLMTHTTNPLLSSATMRRAINEFAGEAGVGKADSLFAVSKHQARFYDRTGRPINHDPKRLIPTQELDPLFEENSTLYLFTRQSFSRTQARIGERPLLFETPALESLDIDEESDWRLVEALAPIQEAITQSQKVD